MRLRCVVARSILPVIILAGFPSLARSNSLEGTRLSGFVMPLTIVNTALLVTNGYYWRHNGSIEYGCAGVILGSVELTLIVLEKEDLTSTQAGVLGVISAVGVINGLGSFLRDVQTDSENQDRLHVSPLLRFKENGLVSGLQLIARW